MARNVYEEKVSPYLDSIRGWARDGLTLEDIAHNLNITRQTLSKYAKAKNSDGSWKYELLHDFLREGKELSDYRVENALFQSAVGYYTTEEKVVKGDDGMKIVEVKVYHPPSVTAQIFWLKNRRPDKWRDKVVLEKPMENDKFVLELAPIEDTDDKNTMETSTKAGGVSKPS